MNIKGNHPLGEFLALKLFSIESEEIIQARLEVNLVCVEFGYRYAVAGKTLDEAKGVIIEINEK